MSKIETVPTAEELLRKIQRLEEEHGHLKQEISNRQIMSNSVGGEESAYANILQSMGQSLHMFDHNDRIIYWNQMAENLFGYTVEEALGKTAPDIIIGPKYSELATFIIQRALKGETWSGQFPVHNKYWETINVITTLSPCRDQNGTTFGVTCVCTDARQYMSQNVSSSLDPHLPAAILSKISILASKVKLKMKTGGANDPDSVEDAWKGKKGISWPWKGRDGSDSHFGWPWPWLHNDQEQTSSSASFKQVYESPSQIKETPGSSWSYSWATSSSWSINSDSTDIHIENLDVEISWDDLIFREQIGQGSRGTVYHALLYGSDVAVKIYNKQKYPDDVILSFRKEVCLMKRLRYPNILLFMGAVVSPHHLCIVTEFLPRGSLFRLLQRGTTMLDWRRRVSMAMDVARGMNYLHHCQPPIIHRNLKSSNLLVDKNWTLKVGDFGLSRIKHETYLATDTGTGMPQWMAPEVLRSEQVDEKCDVYSYGVVLWEITTGKIPWENLNSMQVIGAVGFRNQRLEIPDDVDPQWASLLQSCWSREPQCRPTFEEILIKLKDLQKKFMFQ